MNRAQQVATRVLDEAMAGWLRSYGWQPDGPGRWRHPKLTGGVSYATHDAYNHTRVDKKLGWP